MPCFVFAVYASLVAHAHASSCCSLHLQTEVGTVTLDLVCYMRRSTCPRRLAYSQCQGSVTHRGTAGWYVTLCCAVCVLFFCLCVSSTLLYWIARLKTDRKRNEVGYIAADTDRTVLFLIVTLYQTVVMVIHTRSLHFVLLFICLQCLLLLLSVLFAGFSVCSSSAHLSLLILTFFLPSPSLFSALHRRSPTSLWRTHGPYSLATGLSPRPPTRCCPLGSLVLWGSDPRMSA